MTQLHNPSFPQPTNNADFEHALRRGLGRAIIWLQSGVVPEDRDLILRACLKDWSFNSQGESNRALYMAGVVAATADPAFYISRVLEALAGGGEDDNFDQWYDLAGQFAAAGYADARSAVYTAFSGLLPTDYASQYAEVLLDVDGLAGYRFVVQSWLNNGLAEGDDFSEIHLLDTAEERFGADAVTALIEDETRGAPAMAPYHASVKARHSAWRAGLGKRPQRPAPTYEYLSMMLRLPHQSMMGLFVWANRGRKMGAETAARFAQEALLEADPALRSRILALFGEYQYPGGIEALFAMARGDNAAIARAAALALSAFATPGVRELGIAIMQTEREPWRGARLLRRNFHPGDCAPMLRLLQRLIAPDDIDELGIQIRQVFKENPLPEFAEILILLYEKSMSATSRSSVVDCLIAIDALPEYIVQERTYDASDITRKAIADLA